MRRVLRFVFVGAGVLPIALVLLAAHSTSPENLPAARGGDIDVAAPVISSVTPDTGSVYGGEHVIIKGTGFEGPLGVCARDYDVWFGTDQAEGFAISPPHYSVLTDTEISAVVPANNGGLVNVQFHNRCGTSAIASPDSFTYEYPASQCLHGTCSIEVSTRRVGPLTHAADGLLNGFSGLSGRGSPGLRALLDALRIRQWRMDVFNPLEPYGRVFAYCDQCRRHTAIDFDLTTDWENASGASSYTVAPYADLGAYTTMLRDDVAKRLSLRQPLTYFDPWNEPYAGNISAWLSVYGVAYRVIKALDPRAELVGPSLDTFLTASPGAGEAGVFGYRLNLTDFLNWEQRTGIRYAAISWHENGAPVGVLPSPSGSDVPPAAVPGGRRDDWSPAAIGEHVVQARALLAQYPALRGTKLFVNEYGPPWAVNIPGWMVGDFAALEGARANAAMMTCASTAACTELFDGLIGFDGQPQMPYWVLRAYAHMRGQRLAVTSHGTNLYSLAVRAQRGHEVEALIGRADDCWGEVQCPQFHAASAEPVALKLSLAVPWRTGRVTVTLQKFPDDAHNAIGDNDVPLMPATRRLHVRLVGGLARLRIPEVGDGDAFYVTVTAPPVGRRR